MYAQYRCINAAQCLVLPEGTTPADAEFIASKIRGATCKIIADAGHYIPRERPAEYNAAIEQFVDGLK